MNFILSPNHSTNIFQEFWSEDVFRIFVVLYLSNIVLLVIINVYFNLKKIFVKRKLVSYTGIKAQYPKNVKLQIWFKRLFCLALIPIQNMNAELLNLERDLHIVERIIEKKMQGNILIIFSIRIMILDHFL